MHTKRNWYNFPAHSYTKNYSCWLPLLGDVNWFFFTRVYSQPCKFMTGEMVPMEGSKLVVGTSVRKCLLDIVVKYTGLFWVFVDVIATLNLIIPVITLLFPSWCLNCPILLTHHTSTLAQNLCFPRCHQNFSKSGIIWFALLDM